MPGRMRAGTRERHVAVVAGTRPNFVKAAPLLRALAGRKGLRTTLIHTGQHYDEAMSGVFLRDLEIRPPEVHLQAGSGSHAAQTARLMVRLEAALGRLGPDRVMVVGDVNSTLAAALVAAKLGIPVDHVEAGLRSGDRSMPEEINRLVTDSVADRLFASERAGVENLRREGHARARIHHVGNVMIDSLAFALPRARKQAAWKAHGLDRGRYGVVTLHRPANVDRPEALERLVAALGEAARRLPLVFPVHPRTLRRLRASARPPGLHFTEPLGYVAFLSLLSGAALAITDSGGIQEETTYLRIPCLTLRDNTERPITVTLGTNTLVGADARGLRGALDRILDGRYKRGRVPPLWDGKAARRIAEITHP